MKIKVTHTAVYDTDDRELWMHFEEWMGDHTYTMTSLQEFIVDNFINPNFDKGTTTMEIYNV